MNSKQTDKHNKKRKEHKKNWRELYASIDDIKQFLLERVILRHNVITIEQLERIAEGLGMTLHICFE